MFLFKMSREIIRELDKIEKMLKDAAIELSQIYGSVHTICETKGVTPAVADGASRIGEITSGCIRDIERAGKLHWEVKTRENDAQRGR